MSKDSPLSIKLKRLIALHEEILELCKRKRGYDEKEKQRIDSEIAKIYAEKMVDSRSRPL
jgi:hypothetical protein